MKYIFLIPLFLTACYPDIKPSYDWNFIFIDADGDSFKAECRIDFISQDSTYSRFIDLEEFRVETDIRNYFKIYNLPSGRYDIKVEWTKPFCENPKYQFYTITQILDETNKQHIYALRNIDRLRSCL